MKRLVVLVAVLVIGAQASFANCGKCPGDKAKADKKAASCPSMDKLNLTAEQKTKVEALCGECKKGSCDKTAEKKLQAGMKEILTADQYKQWNELCQAQSAKGGCCASKKAAPAAEKKSE
jgi:Spy/CpxP family protein refolding chaperone